MVWILHDCMGKSMRIPKYDQTPGSDSPSQWIDPTSQVDDFFGSQIVPGTPHVIELNAAFEKAVYDTLKQEA